MFHAILLYILVTYFHYRCEKETPKIHIYDGRGSNTPLHILEKLHYKPVTLIKVSTCIWLDKIVWDKLFDTDLFYDLLDMVVKYKYYTCSWGWKLRLVAKCESVDIFICLENSVKSTKIIPFTKKKPSHPL
jgi:hypothetical protein